MVAALAIVVVLPRSSGGDFLFELKCLVFLFLALVPGVMVVLGGQGTGDNVDALQGMGGTGGRAAPNEASASAASQQQLTQDH